MPSIEAMTSAALGAALDLAAREQALAAANIANANSEAYVPLHVSFDASLARAREALADQGRLDPAAVQEMQPRLQATPPVTGWSAQVRVDSEMVALARNAVQFQALAQGLSRHLGLLALAAGDGKR